MIEEKLKKVTTEKAPVAGQTPGGAASGGRLGRQAAVPDVGAIGGGGLADALRAAIQDSGDNGGTALNEVLRATAAGRYRPAMFQRRVQMPDASGGGAGSGEGAAAAAGVLTAVDEDDEGAEEAAVPGEFEYFTENEDEEEL